MFGDLIKLGLTPDVINFMTIVDDYSRFTWIHLLKHRTECVKVMTDFFFYIENQFKKKV